MRRRPLPRLPLAVYSASLPFHRESRRQDPRCFPLFLRQKPPDENHRGHARDDILGRPTSSSTRPAWWRRTSRCGTHATSRTLNPVAVLTLFMGSASALAQPDRNSTVHHMLEAGAGALAMAWRREGQWRRRRPFAALYAGPSRETFMLNLNTSVHTRTLLLCAVALAWDRDRRPRCHRDGGTHLGWEVTKIDKLSLGTVWRETGTGTCTCWTCGRQAPAHRALRKRRLPRP